MKGHMDDEARTKRPDESGALLPGRGALDELIDFGVRQTKELGIAEADVETLIAEVRAERRVGG